MRDEKLKQLVVIAREIGALSTCKRKVGCILMDAVGIIKATGYNGPPSNMGDCSCLSRESGKDLDLCPAIHAEMNALIQCADVANLYWCVVTTKPCRHCIKMLMNTGVTTIIYLEDYPHGEVEKLWESSGKERSIRQMVFI